MEGFMILLMCFEAMPEKNVVSYNAMLSGYLGIDDFMSARKMFDEMGERNVASWNAMINGYVKVETFQAIRASQVLFWHVQTLETLSALRCSFDTLTPNAFLFNSYNPEKSHLSGRAGTSAFYHLLLDELSLSSEFKVMQFLNIWLVHFQELQIIGNKFPISSKKVCEFKHSGWFVALAFEAISLALITFRPCFQSLAFSIALFHH
ncbi:hypothetical protein CQW23_12132 [Capsicum baccatum]|uniref:Pentatricopeptide repeat-containing protein n=1 Tax=Capsicum baccatum TaxID=33114 RepID=A0A2G2WRR3_CAPBA|nr:hypothetical protein CQW23_12132 [Capsicum baccatum]